MEVAASKRRTCAVAAVLSMLSAGSTAFSGFGGNILFQVGWIACGFLGLTDGKALTATVMVQVLYLSFAALQSVALIGQTPWGCVAYSIPTMAVGYATGLGALLWMSALERAEPFIKLAIAAVLLLVAVLELPRAGRILRQLRHNGAECFDRSQATPPEAAEAESARVVALVKERSFSGGVLNPSPRGPRAPAAAPIKGAGVRWADRTPLFTVAFIVRCVLYGLFHGMTSVGGPPAMIFALVFNPNSFEYRATLAWSTLFIHAFVFFPAMMWLKVLHLSSQWPLLVICCVAQVAGITIGNYLANQVNQDVWVLSVYVVVVCAGLSLSASTLVDLVD